MVIFFKLSFEFSNFTFSFAHFLNLDFKFSQSHVLLYIFAVKVQAFLSDFLQEKLSLKSVRDKSLGYFISHILSIWVLQE